MSPPEHKAFTSTGNITSGLAKPDKLSIYEMLQVNLGQSEVITCPDTLQRRTPLRQLYGTEQPRFHPRLHATKHEAEKNHQV